MTELSRDIKTLVSACLRGAVGGAVAAQRADLVDDLLAVAEVVARSGGDLPSLREAGRATVPDAGVTALILRGLPYGLLTPLDRPRLRLGSYRAAAISGSDELTAVTAVAVAVLTADLARGFSVEDAGVRCHQTLLEEAPSGLLGALSPFGDLAVLERDASPLEALRLTITALHRCAGLADVITLLTGEGRTTSPVLAGALAGLRAGDAAGAAMPAELEPRVSAVADQLGAAAAARLPVPASTNGSHV